jgi:polyisoprenoid-binding protein YceI
MNVFAARFGALFVLAAMSSAGVYAQPAAQQAAQQVASEKLHLDPSATEVRFTLKDTLHTVHGSFHLKAGDVVFNPQSGEAEGLISVDAGSGSSGNDTRDGRMRREFLEVTSFPVATFTPQKVSGFNPAASSQKISVAGTMTLHGGSHPMTMEFTVTQEGALTTATTRFAIPYVDWGIKSPGIAFVKVEKEVTMDIVAKGTLTAEK